MARKDRTIGYIPLIQGQPCRFSGTDGQLCYCDAAFPMKIERHYATVRRQIARTKRNRAAWGFMDRPSDTYTILRVVG